jgi:hypothetical protein
MTAKKLCSTVIQNEHTEDKTDYTEGSFYDILNSAFNRFHAYHMKIYLKDFKTNYREKIFLKLRIKNDSLYETSNYMR